MRRFLPDIRIIALAVPAFVSVPVLCAAEHIAPYVSVIRLVNADRDTIVRSVSVKKDGSAVYLPVSETKELTVPRAGYAYIRIAKPEEIEKADRLREENADPVKVRDAYRKAGEKYGLLGWDLHCAAREAEAIGKSGDRKEAMKRLLQLKEQPFPGEIFRRDVYLVRELLLDLYLETGAVPEAQKMAEEFLKESDAEAAAFGYLHMGDIASSKKDFAEAEKFYLQGMLLFPESSRCPEMIFREILLLRFLKDNRSKEFEALLKARYPRSPFLKKL